MPGVPSSRGCNACRKQKKKCDQVKPACGRCARLGLACVGSGVQRYKFKPQRVMAAGKPRRSADAVAALPTPRPSPTGPATAAAGALISVLQVQDVRWDALAFGPFFEDLPRRMGTSPALDASIGALTTAFGSLRLGAPKHKYRALAEYGQALTSLRTTLQDPVQARSPNTMCAIYLVLVCEQWIGNAYLSPANHSQVLFHLLHDATTQGWIHQLDQGMLRVLLVTTILECSCNPNLRLGPWFFELLQSHGPQPLQNQDGLTMHSIDIPALAQISEFLRAPVKYRLAISANYALIRQEYPRVRDTLALLTAQASAPDAAFAHKRACARFQSAYATMVAHGALLNRALRMLGDDDGFLALEAGLFCDEALDVARAAVAHRPLSASIMPVALTLAWVAVPELPRRADVEALLEEYAADFEDARWRDKVKWMKTNVDNTLPLESVPHEELAGECPADWGGYDGSCVIL